MLLGYNTNGFAHHDPLEALDVLAALGYQSVALTLDHGLLDPRSPRLEREAEHMRHALLERGLRSVVETGARFLLDPWTKHEPTLVSADPQGRARRTHFLCRAIDVAALLGSDCVSLWAGVVRDGAPDAIAWDRLVGALAPVLDHAARRQVPIGFEPEPGMLVDTMARYDRLRSLLPSPWLRLTLDIGHLHCQGELPLADYIGRYGPQLVNLHLEDMRAGVHEHLQLGEGEIEFPPVIAALVAADYRRGVHLELSRHSHLAPEAARRARDFLAPLLPAGAIATQPR